MSTVMLLPARPVSRPVMSQSTIVHWIVLSGMAIVYIALFSYYYPCTYGIEDEVGYINQAVVMSRGAISAEGAGFDTLREFGEFKGRHVNWRNPGRSFLILPFLQMGGLSAVFVSGAVIHLLLTLVTALTFTRLERSPLWAVLVLCHPTLAIYSRTIMGDAPAALGLSCALLAFVSTTRPGWWAGAAIGLAAVMRYQAGLTLPFFALAIWYAPHVVQRGRQVCYCLLAGGVFGVSILCYNQYLYGNLLGWVSQGSFALRFVPYNIAFYTAALCTVWPLMLPSLVLDRSPIRWVSRAICLPLLLLMLGWHAFDHHPSWSYSLVIGQRYLIPVLPVWIVTYALCLERVFYNGRVGVVLARWSHRLAAFGCVALLALLAAVFQRHDAHLHHLRSAREDVTRIVPEGSLVIANYTLEKLFGVPSPNIPTYRWRLYDDHGMAQDQSKSIHVEQRTWYLALLPKTPGSELPELLRDYVARYNMSRIRTDHPTLILYKAAAGPTTEPGPTSTSKAGVEGNE